MTVTIIAEVPWANTNFMLVAGKMAFDFPVEDGVRDVLDIKG